VKNPLITKKTVFFRILGRKTLVLQVGVIYTCAQVAVDALYIGSFAVLVAWQQSSEKGYQGESCSLCSRVNQGRNAAFFLTELFPQLSG
jgi:hypothetical protein